MPQLVEITVEADTTAPELTLVTSTIEVTATGSTGAAVDVLADSGASATDNCDTDPVITEDGPGTFPRGTTEVTITATDASGNSASEVVTVTVLNQQPTANAGGDFSVECTSPGNTFAMLDGSLSSDGDEDPLMYSWTGPFGTVTGANPQVSLPLGTHTITLTVDDGQTGIDSDTVDVTIQDTTSPQLTLATTLIEVTPTAPGSGIATVNVVAASGAVANDVCDLSPGITDDGPGDYPLGTTVVNITATDASGNASAPQQVSVTVVNGPPTGGPPGPGGDGPPGPDGDGPPGQGGGAPPGQGGGGG